MAAYDDARAHLAGLTDHQLIDLLTPLAVASSEAQAQRFRRRNNEVGEELRSRGYLIDDRGLTFRWYQRRPR